MAQQKLTLRPHLVVREKDETQRRQFRLFYLVILTTWTFATIGAPYLAF